jgi:anthranilate synthase component I
MRRTAALHVRPDRETFDGLARTWTIVPVYAELLADVSTPVGAFVSLAGDGPGTLLESVERSERWGRYSFVSGPPALTLVHDGRSLTARDVVRDLPFDPRTTVGDDALSALKAAARALRAPRLPGLPALAGGFVGVIAYEAAGLLDGLPTPAGPAGCPPISLQVVDRAIVFDHWRQRLLLIAHVPGGGPDAYGAGVAALEELSSDLSRTPPPQPQPVRPVQGVSFEPVASMGPDEYVAAVARTKEHILAGDIFQAVLSRRLAVPWQGTALGVYRRLRVTNPAPYMFFLRMPGGFELAGSSPEPLVRVEGRTVSSRPIAGTRRRGATQEEDLELERGLLADPKERAEHAMLVDLARNDLGRVCSPGTVRPSELMQIERFSQVMHIVSTVEGELRDDLEPLDALAATFPAGTVTGAPKRRAMDIIAGEEPVARGAYAGAVGYLTFAGDLDVCITIRTAVADGTNLFVQSGAGIVHDSDPLAELRETEVKASAVLAAVEGART